MLNKEQQHAVLCQDRVIFLYAGAGTGKTTVMIERIKDLIRNGVPETAILALTFTHKASIEMKHRLAVDNVVMKTFHGWCYEYGKKTELVPEYAPFSLREKQTISTYKNTHMTSSLPNRFKTYATYLKKNKLKDFDDLMIQAIHENGYGKKYAHILVDEFQDTNLLQLQLLKVLIRHDTHLFAVGDPDQSIYKFRGAIPNVVDVFIEMFQAKTLFLTHNYRSYKQILFLANHLLKYDKKRVKKALLPTYQKNGHLFYRKYRNKSIEAEDVLSYVSALKGTICILSRNNERLFHMKETIHQAPMFLEMKVNILTMHQSKGLEFDHIIIIGMEQVEIPGQFFLSHATVQEERRLLFVAITRAKKSILFTRVTNHGTPTQFLRELRIKP